MANRDNQGKFAPGNQFAASHYSFNDALRRAIDKKNLSRKEKMDILEEIADKMLERALESGSEANSVANRLDGLPKQAVEHTGALEHTHEHTHGFDKSASELLGSIRSVT
jgi:hypothetical protein